jgi:zinc/manganese transport system substrate-binding protein
VRQRSVLRSTLLLAIALLVAALAGCGDDDGSAGAAGQERPQVVVTTNVLGDVVGDLVGDLAEVEVIMPPGSSPHDFQASPQQAAAMREADVLITNGAGFEEGLGETIEAAEQDGVPTFAAIDAVETLSLDDAEEHAEDEDAPSDEHAEDEDAPSDEHAEDEDEHGHEGIDPHFFTDPARMATAAQAVADFLVDEVPALDTAAFADQVDAVVDDLQVLDRQVDETLAAVPPERRTLVTNHEVFGYFADRYGFEVVGAVIPAGTTQAEPSAAELDGLATAIEDRGVPAIFVETSSPTRLADALASEVDGIDVEVVELFTESLGDEGSGGETYADMMRTNARRITEALAA